VNFGGIKKMTNKTTRDSGRRFAQFRTCEESTPARSSSSSAAARSPKGEWGITVRDKSEDHGKTWDLREEMFVKRQ
jgi:hypothetical protein